MMMVLLSPARALLVRLLEATAAIVVVATLAAARAEAATAVVAVVGLVLAETARGELKLNHKDAPVGRTTTGDGSRK